MEIVYCGHDIFVDIFSNNINFGISTYKSYLASSLFKLQRINYISIYNAVKIRIKKKKRGNLKKRIII